MKFRTDFVTNSSSSSFVTLNANSKTLGEILDKYSDELCDDYCANYSNKDGQIEFYIDEGYADVPYLKKQIVKCVAEIFDMFNDEISEEIRNKEKEILADLKEFKMETGDVGWQGDSDSRFYPENYSKKRLKGYYKAIAEEKGCSVKEVTEDDFCEYVSDKISVDERVAVYNHETGKISVKKDFYLE